MIEAAFFVSDNQRSSIGLTTSDQRKLAFDIVIPPESFAIEIIFDQPIDSFRNHDYNWTNISADRFAGSHSPKIIRLQDGNYVQANIMDGYWEIRQANPKMLRWHFNSVEASPLTVYEGQSNAKTIVPASPRLRTVPALLFSPHYAIEFSRSKLPFSAVACFTDHCDFDTAENLQLQRALFKSAGVRVTKGFFLHHFSKRNDNASWQNDSAELQEWLDDGHELAYHSLSQSIKPVADSLSDFQNFDPPFAVTTYIDHGYQPYNFSLYRHELNDQNYASTLRSKGIDLLWNYIDAGTAASGIINQMNPYDFTLGRFWSAHTHLPFKTRVAMLIRNAVFHHDGSTDLIRSYMGLASGIKNIRNLTAGKIARLAKDFFVVSGFGLKLAATWKRMKNRPFKHAKAAPLVFRHRIADTDFLVFQTIEMTDFKSALSRETIQKLIDESGLFIAHTYFSAPLSYHFGRMFKLPRKTDETVSGNFQYLGEMIKNGKIWNPTVKELAVFLSGFDALECDVDGEGKIILKSGHIKFRMVK